VRKPPMGLNVDARLLQQELTDLDQIADRVRLANFGLAQPLIAMRRAQAEKEALRVARRKGEGHPETRSRRAAAARLAERHAAFQGDLERVRAEPPTVKEESGAGLYGRVVEGTVPVADATVVVSRAGERLGYGCTDARGAFAFELPAGEGLEVSVRTADGDEPYRDAVTFTLQPDQRLYLEIDLARPGPQPCPPPPPDDPEPPAGVGVPDIVGLPEKGAIERLRAVGLRVGERTEQPGVGQAGRVLAQTPAAGTTVRPNDAVAIVVGVSEKPRATVPAVVGSPLDEAAQLLARAELEVGEVGEVVAGSDVEGRVVGQQPASGAGVSPGSTVDLTVGRPLQDDSDDGRPADSVLVGRAAERAETGLRERNIATAQPEGFLALRLQEAGVEDTAALEALLGNDRREVRDVLGLRTLAETDRAIAALKRALADVRK
jgi:hypothetical protein